LPLSAQRAVNGYAETQPSDAKNDVAVFGPPGITTFATCGNGPIRGFFEMNGVVYIVSGNDFYSLDSTGAETLRGTGITGLGVVSMDGNGTQVIIVNGTLGWVYNTSTAVFAQISDGDFDAADTVTFIDQYFALDEKGTNQFNISDALDGTSYDPLNFASAESSPDRVIAVRSHGGILYLFNEGTIELWDHTGAVSFPFQRFDGGSIPRGLLAPHAITEEDTALFFLGDDRIFYRLDRRGLRRVSTHAIEQAWEKYGTVSDAFCFSIPHDGHKFVYLTFPTESKTWCTDIATGYLWHERESFTTSGSPTRWRVNAAKNIRSFQKVLVGDNNSGQIGQIDSTVYTEFGEAEVMTLTSAPLHSPQDGRLMFMPRLEIDMETGVGLATGQGSDPQAMLDWSDDGGRTFTVPQMWRSMGPIGDYQTRLQWNELGSFYQRCLRLSVSDPVKRRLIAARAPGMYVGA